MNQIRMIRNLLASAVLVFVVAFAANAQKFGHLNSAQLMAELPAIKSADTQLQTYQQQLNKKGEDMVTAFQTAYNDYMGKANSGTISQIQAAEIEADLQKSQLEIQNYQQEVQQKMVTKRQELYEPIFDKVRKVIEDYGKANGYTMIFDSSIGAILFEDSEDLTEAIKASL